MKKKSLIINLVILNLFVILIILLNKIETFREFINVIFSIIIIPIIFGVFLFYILKPLNNIFIRKNIKSGRAAALTLLIFFFIASGVIKYFGDYLINQIINLKRILFRVVEEKGNLYGVDSVFNWNMVKLDYYNKFLGDIKSYSILIFGSCRKMIDRSMQLFSDVLLVVLIVFYLLKDEEQFKESMVKLFPRKYRDKADNFIEESDTVLSSYIIGQAKVAFSLALMVYAGYKVIGMTSPLILASITFILAFIPFVGFFISMIIPYIIAMALGWHMLIKLSILVVIAQILKGRVVVPFIMGKAMKIHPITDIFLVVGAAALVGPIGAFVIIPIYSVGKVFLKHFNQEIKGKLKEFRE